MTVLLVAIWVVLSVCLVILSAILPERTHHSWFELRHRANEYAMERERRIADIEGIHRVVTGVLLIVLTIVGLALWQAWGVIAVMVMWVLSGWIARQKIVHKFAMRLYKKYEASLLGLLTKTPLIGRIVRYQTWHPRDQRIESPEHLLHLVEDAGAILSQDQQRIIHHGLDWHSTPVASIMVARKDIVSIKHSELLGPLVLDDLHHSGHNRFPVIKGTIDTVVGILDITELLEIDSGKRSQTAEQAMSQRVLHVASDEPLPAALSLLQKSRQHLLVVTDQEGKTVGLVTLADITNSLLGRLATPTLENKQRK